MVDTRDLKSLGRKAVPVRVRFPVPKKQRVMRSPVSGYFWNASVFIGSEVSPMWAWIKTNMSLNRNQRHALAGFCTNLAVGYILTLTVGPMVLPDPSIPRLFLAAWGFLAAGALLFTSIKLSR